MASIRQPDEVVRLDPNDAWNRLSTYGFKWHLFRIDPKDHSVHKTSCGMVVEKRQVEFKLFLSVKTRDLCSTCFKGQMVVD